MSKIKFTLEETLNELNITKNKLAVESKIRSNTIIDMVTNQTKSIKLITLIDILDTLNRLGKEQGLNRTFDVDDVFIYLKK